MSFADEYLQEHSISEKLFKENPDVNLHSVIAIPAYNESGLVRCLDSLFICDAPESNTEVIVLINSSENTSKEILEVNRKSFRDIKIWMEAHKRQDMRFHVYNIENLPKKHFGAGMARKLVMDEAIRRLNAINHPRGIIFSLDADTSVAKNYLLEVIRIFGENKQLEGCSISFEHPVQGNVYPEAVYDAIVNYELHQRYYLQAVRYTGYPYAHHTVGSCFAVKAETYCKQGGMSKRQAGEDFYFIQKVAMQGHYMDCTNTMVYPSPRPSDRVPFGTGPNIAKQLAMPSESYQTFNPVLFVHLKAFYEKTHRFFDNDYETIKTLAACLQNYLETSQFSEELREIRSNVASPGKFKERFFRKFNMFWILKYLHYAEEYGIKKIEIAEAARILLHLMGVEVILESKLELLKIFRDREKHEINS